MAISRSLRFQILRRDDHACRYCGAMAPDVKLHIDHVTPVALGGTDDPANLVTACSDCNSGKSATPADAEKVAEVAQDAERWARAMQAAAGAKELEEAAEDIRRREIIADFSDVWEEYRYGSGGLAVPRPAGWQQSVIRFIDVGLPMSMLIKAVHAAMANDRVSPVETFRYMCGIAWKQVSELQEAARAIIDAEGSQSG